MVSSFLLKRTFVVERFPASFLKSIYRDRFYEALYAAGAYKVKRVGDSRRTRLFVSFVEDNRSNEELAEIINLAILNYIK